MTDEQKERSELEVSGALDGFLDLEEIAQDLDWLEVYADAWGVPYSRPSTVQPKQNQLRLARVLTAATQVFLAELIDKIVWAIWRLRTANKRLTRQSSSKTTPPEPYHFHSEA